MVAAPYLGTLVYAAEWDTLLIGLTMAAALDVADGAIARAWPSQASKIGSYLDPVADKVLLACVALPLAGEALLPTALIGLWVARDVTLIACGFALRAAARPPGVAFFDSSHSETPQVEPSTISKVNTGIQLAIVFWAIASRGTILGDFLPHADGGNLFWMSATMLSAVTTIGSAAGYWKNGWKVWNQIKDKKTKKL
jgi:cardiolipin synthase (CMP-forming)